MSLWHSERVRNLHTADSKPGYRYSMVNREPLGVNVGFCERRGVGWVKREDLVDKTLFKIITLLEEFAEVTSILPEKWVTFIPLIIILFYEKMISMTKAYSGKSRLD